jgi:septal ring factor EnvC (AmiA/AmiB activator)
MVAAAHDFHLVYKILEATGYAGAGVSVIYCAGKYVVLKIVAAFKRFEAATASLADVANINENVKLIMTNHLPHLQADITETKQQFTAIASDVKGVRDDVKDLGKQVIVLNTQQEMTEKSLTKLGQVFVQHLEKSAGKE